MEDGLSWVFLCSQCESFYIFPMRTSLKNDGTTVDRVFLWSEPAETQGGGPRNTKRKVCISWVLGVVRESVKVRAGDGLSFLMCQVLSSQSA